MIHVAVSNLMTIVDHGIIFALQSSTAGSRRSPTEASVSIAFGRVIGEQVGLEILSELDKDVASQVVTHQDVMVTVAHKRISSDESMVLFVGSVARTVEEE